MRAHEQNIETDILVVLLIKKKFYLHNAIITITNRSKKNHLPIWNHIYKMQNLLLV